MQEKSVEIMNMNAACGIEEDKTTQHWVGTVAHLATTSLVVKS